MKTDKTRRPLGVPDGPAVLPSLARTSPAALVLARPPTSQLGSEQDSEAARQAQEQAQVRTRSETPNCALKSRQRSQQPFASETATLKVRCPTESTSTTLPTSRELDNLPNLVHIQYCREAAAQTTKLPATSHQSNKREATLARGAQTEQTSSATAARMWPASGHRRKCWPTRGDNKRTPLPLLIKSPLLAFLLGFVVAISCLPLLFGLRPLAHAHQSFEAQPEQQYIVESGREVRLRCLIRQRQGECLWLRNGRATSFIAKKYHYSKSPDDGDCSLMIRNATVQNDDGLWQCQVTSTELDHDNSLQSRESQLVVLVAPERPQIKNTVSRGEEKCSLAACVCVCVCWLGFARSTSREGEGESQLHCDQAVGWLVGRRLLACCRIVKPAKCWPTSGSLRHIKPTQECRRASGAEWPSAVVVGDF